MIGVQHTFQRRKDPTIGRTKPLLASLSTKSLMIGTTSTNSPAGGNVLTPTVALTWTARSRNCHIGPHQQTTVMYGKHATSSKICKKTPKHMTPATSKSTMRKPPTKKEPFAPNTSKRSTLLNQGPARIEKPPRMQINFGTSCSQPSQENKKRSQKT